MDDLSKLLLKKAPSIQPPVVNNNKKKGGRRALKRKLQDCRRENEMLKRKLMRYENMSDMTALLDADEQESNN